MTNLHAFHEDYGGAFTNLSGRTVVAHYGKPDRAHLAVRNGVGVTEQPYDVLVITGEDRIEYVDNVLSNAIPSAPGDGVYALLLDPKGRIRLDAYVYVAEERLLLFLPPGKGPDIAGEWGERVFIQDVDIVDATNDYIVLTVTGPKATEKLASVTNEPVPQERFAFVQDTIADAGITCIPTDGVTGEESYDIVCASYDAKIVMDTLLNRGQNAVPFGRETWETLTLEAGTPILESDLEDELPNISGIRNALDFEKGCFVGQEVVSRIENRGRPNERLVGLELDEVAVPGPVHSDTGDEIGRITRAMASPTLERPIALAYVAFDETEGEVVSDGGIAGSIATLPFVNGSARSARLPSYGE